MCAAFSSLLCLEETSAVLIILDDVISVRGLDHLVDVDPKIAEWAE